MSILFSPILLLLSMLDVSTSLIRCCYTFSFYNLCLFPFCFVVAFPLFLLCWLPCLSCSIFFYCCPFFLLLTLISNYFYFIHCRSATISTMPVLFFKMSQYWIFSSPLEYLSLSFFLLYFLQVSVRRGFTFSQDRQPVERGLLADQRLRL